MSVKAFFTKEELARVLKEGNDERNNSLIVDWEGNIQLVPFTNDSKTYAVRFETFVAGNGYVGARSKLNHLDGTYQALLEGWVSYLQYGQSKHIGIYRDYAEYKKSIEELQQEAIKLIS
ncbi:protein kinase [Paenibacillus amylolyticus]|uniref:protein kinase n=1 Tax=Paenibacillus amylolyticus TaxID=1451 RepID=UPI000FDA6323|nr:protein kinase [Paenibacillus amylolyticus]